MNRFCKDACSGPFQQSWRKIRGCSRRCCARLGLSGYAFVPGSRRSRVDMPVFSKLGCPEGSRNVSGLGNEWGSLSALLDCGS